MIPDADVGKHVLIYSAHRFLPPFIGAIMMTTIIGIIISTADSYLLVPSTTIMRDVYQKHISKELSEKKIVFFSRLVVLILGIIAYIISIGFSKSSGFFDKALYAYTIYGAAITPALVAALFWENVSKIGAILSISSGAITTLVWKESLLIKEIVPNIFYTNVDEVLPAISISILALFFGSKIFPDSKK